MSSQRNDWRERLHANPSRMEQEPAIKLQHNRMNHLATNRKYTNTASTDGLKVRPVLTYDGAYGSRDDEGFQQGPSRYSGAHPRTARTDGWKQALGLWGRRYHHLEEGRIRISGDQRDSSGCQEEDPGAACYP